MAAEDVDSMPSTARAGTRLSYAAVLLGLSGLVLAMGLLMALSTLSRGPWMDEFNTLVTTLRGNSLDVFFAHAMRGQHPLLYEGAIYIAQALGVTDIAALRLLNLVGVPLAVGAVWASYRNGALTLAQAATVVALYASSVNFLTYFAFVRPYFLVFSASIAVSLAWRVMMRPVADGAGARALAFWGVTLAIFVNLHFFATILGGCLTLGLLVDRWLRNAWRDAFLIAAVSLVAAAPALIMGALEARYTIGAGVLYYFPPDIQFALSAVLRAIVAGFADNVVAVGCAIAAALFLWERPAAWRDARDPIILCGVVAFYLGLLLAANALKPMILDRYLIAASGGVLVPVAVLSAGRMAPKYAPIAVCLVALLVQDYDLAYNRLGWTGWNPSSGAIAQKVRDCPSTAVYAVAYARVTDLPIATTPLNPTEIEARRYGYRYYAAKYHFSYQELAPGAVVGAGKTCPAVIWIEHFWPDGRMSAEDLLANLELRAAGPADFDQIGSGVLVTVAPAS
jgi:hypothetical protein